MKPKTLEEALVIIEGLKEKNKTVIEEKKEVLRIFDEKMRENMTENEKRIADALEDERAARIKEREEFDEYKKGKEQEAQNSVSTMINDAVLKVAKGDKDFETTLRANIDVLEKLPRNNEVDIQNLVKTAYSMSGGKEANPFNAPSYGNTNIDPNTTSNFADTEQGKALGSLLGLSEEPKQ